jgi:hypothetical protein
VNYKFPSTETMITSITYQLQAMIMSGYIRMTSSMIYLEIVIAGARSGIPLRETYFEIADPDIGMKEKLQLLRWQVFLSKALHIPLNDAYDEHHEHRMSKILVRRSDGSYRVSIHSVCVAIVHATSQCQKSIGQRFITLLALLNTAIPAYMTDLPSSKMDVTFYISILSINLIYYVVMLNILYGAVQEMTRKSCFSDILESMIRLHDYNLKANVRFGGGGGSTDDRVITSEIKTIQDLICENTDMIRLSTCGENDQDCKGVALRASLLTSQTGKPSNDRPSSTYVNTIGDSDNDYDEDGVLNMDLESGVSEKPSLFGYYGFSSGSSLTDDSTVSVPGSSMDDFHFPQIELLKYSDNFTTWMQCRKILHNFGYRFSFRLNALLGKFPCGMQS